MIARLSEQLLLRPEDLAPSRPDFEVVGAFNPGAALLGDEVILLVRVAERPRERRPGFTALPRWDERLGTTIDWTPDEELEPVDPRVVKRRADGLVRLTFLSHLRVVRCGPGTAVVSLDGAGLWPESPIEEFGVEDPRITFVEGRYWITYVAVSRHGASTALASTTDFRHFERHGLIFCVENKDVVLFPERVAGEFVAIHRPNGATPFTRPEMWLARSPDLLHWGRHEPLPFAGGPWESGRVGAGPPPVRTAEGWLALYHGNRRPTRLGEVGAYAAGAVLLDAEEPSRVLKRTGDAVFAPTADFERQGFVPDVVFPTGIVERGPTLLVYYGAADRCTGVVQFSREELLGTLQPA